MPSRPIRHATIPIASGPALALPPAVLPITEALQRDHDEVRARIAQIRSDPGSVARNYPVIADALRRHSTAEERTLYDNLQAVGSALRQQGQPELGDQILAQIATSRQQHQALASMLRRLDGISFDSPMWMPRFETAVGALNTHLATEETVVFAEARSAFPPPIQIEMGANYEAMMHALMRAPVRVGAARLSNPPERAEVEHFIVHAPILNLLFGKQ